MSEKKTHLLECSSIYFWFSFLHALKITLTGPHFLQIIVITNNLHDNHSFSSLSVHGKSNGLCPEYYGSACTLMRTVVVRHCSTALVGTALSFWTIHNCTITTHAVIIAKSLSVTTLVVLPTCQGTKIQFTMTAHCTGIVKLHVATSLQFSWKHAGNGVTKRCHCLEGMDQEHFNGELIIVENATFSISSPD